MHYLRLLALSGMLGLAACGGGSSGGGLGNIFGANMTSCDPGAQTQLANPQPGQSAVSTNMGQIEIVTNGSSNAVYNNPGNWHLYLTDNLGDAPIDSGSLNLTSDQFGPHPYGSDFYFKGSIPTLRAGATYTVFLQQGADGATCSPLALQSFNT